MPSTGPGTDWVLRKCVEVNWIQGTLKSEYTVKISISVCIWKGVCPAVRLDNRTWSFCVSSDGHSMVCMCVCTCTRTHTHTFCPWWIYVCLVNSLPAVRHVKRWFQLCLSGLHPALNAAFQRCLFQPYFQQRVNTGLCSSRGPGSCRSGGTISELTVWGQRQMPTWAPSEKPKLESRFSLGQAVTFSDLPESSLDSQE